VKSLLHYSTVPLQERFNELTNPHIVKA